MATSTENGHVYSLPWVMTKPNTIPVQSETVFSKDFFMEEMTISNPTASAISVTIYDRQGTPLAFLNNTNIAAYSAVAFNMKARYFPGGLTWQASSSGLIGFIRGRVRS